MEGLGLRVWSGVLGFRAGGMSFRVEGLGPPRRYI